MKTTTKIRTTNRIRTTHPYPLITPRERLAIWEKARGMWKNRKPNPIKELKKLRSGWERKAKKKLLDK